jgi:hypothetical protein
MLDAHSENENKSHSTPVPDGLEEQYAFKDPGELAEQKSGLSRLGNLAAGEESAFSYDRSDNVAVNPPARSYK